MVCFKYIIIIFLLFSYDNKGEQNRCISQFSIIKAEAYKQKKIVIE